MSYKDEEITFAMAKSELRLNSSFFPSGAASCRGGAVQHGGRTQKCSSVDVVRLSNIVFWRL
jgi:hypothetical protein